MILFMDTRVHSRKDLKGAVSIPFLGEVPQDKEAAKAGVAVGEEDGMLAESFRILRTNMTFMVKTNRCKSSPSLRLMKVRERRSFPATLP